MLKGVNLRRQRLCGRFGGLQALQEPFFSPPGAGYARAWWRKKDFWGDKVSPNPSLRKLSSLSSNASNAAEATHVDNDLITIVVSGTCAIIISDAHKTCSLMMA